MKSRIVIGDVHGHFKTLMALIKKLPSDIPITFVGDLIDRGPDSLKVVNFVRKNNYDCVLGNHEDMMIEYSRIDLKSNMWINNGGDSTIKNYQNKSATFKKHLKWIEQLPLMHQYNDIGLIVSHSSCADFINKKDTVFSILWDRVEFPEKIEGFFNIYGHTPQKQPIIESHFAIIDTGCFIDWNNEYGKLTALQYPEMEIYQQKRID